MTLASARRMLSGKLVHCTLPLGRCITDFSIVLSLNGRNHHMQTLCRAVHEPAQLSSENIYIIWALVVRYQLTFQPHFNTYADFAASPALSMLELASL